jgi:nucleoside-diphosphate-sugar epimerase
MRVLLTGATGFVGRALCPALVAAGHDVAAAVRNPDHPDIPENATVHVVPDIGPETDWTSALSGANAVIHLAARAHVMKEHARDPMAEFNRINAEGTGCLARAAAKAGIGRFVYLSTVKVMGERSAAPFRETDTPRPEDTYGKSKLAGEQALTTAAADTGLEPVILRAPLVYGPGAKGNFLALMKLCQAAPPLPFSATDNRRSFIYLGNLVDAIGQCLTADGAAGETYFVRDAEDLSTPALIRHVAAALGRPARLFPAPAGFLRLAGAITGKAQAISTLLGDLQVDDEKIRRQLGWNPPFNVVQGLKETAAWFSP